MTKNNILVIVWKRKDGSKLVLVNRFRINMYKGKIADTHNVRISLETSDGNRIDNLKPNQSIADRVLHSRKLLANWPKVRNWK